MLLDLVPIEIMRERRSRSGHSVCPSVADKRQSAYPIFRYAPATVPLFGAGEEALNLHSDEAGLPLRFDRNLKNWEKIDAIAASVFECALRRSLRLVPILRDDCLCSV
jgi:hypothetical protein